MLESYLRLGFHSHLLHCSSAVNFFTEDNASELFVVETAATVLIILLEERL